MKRIRLLQILITIISLIGTLFVIGNFIHDNLNEKIKLENWIQEEKVDIAKKIKLRDSLRHYYQENYFLDSIKLIRLKNGLSRDESRLFSLELQLKEKENLRIELIAYICLFILILISFLSLMNLFHKTYLILSLKNKNEIKINSIALDITYFLGPIMVIVMFYS